MGPIHDRGTLVLVDLEPTRGSEQGFRRPCVVVSNMSAVRTSRSRPLYVIIPFTSNPNLTGPLAPRISARAGGLPMDSTALVMHVRSIDPSRVERNIGRLVDHEMVQISNGLRALLGI